MRGLSHLVGGRDSIPKAPEQFPCCFRESTRRTFFLQLILHCLRRSFFSLQFAPDFGAGIFIPEDKKPSSGNGRAGACSKKSTIQKS